MRSIPGRDSNSLLVETVEGGFNKVFIVLTADVVAQEVRTDACADVG